MFVELLDLQLQGLVHVSTISRQFVSFDSARKTLRSGPDSFSIGMKVKVRVVKVDFDKRRIDFVLIGEPDSRTPGKRTDARPVEAKSPTSAHPSRQPRQRNPRSGRPDRREGKGSKHRRGR
jgi:ribonuclease R